MKKGVLFLFLFIFLIFIIFPLASAALNETQERIKIDKAYNCLENKVNTTERCSALTTEEKVFSLLAVGECEAELISDSSNNGECWPSSNCRIKTTSQAILALENTGTNTEKAQSWLLNQTRATTDLTWFLEIESPQTASCTVGYSGLSFNVDISEDKKLSNGAGGCLTLSDDSYWLRIAPSCFDETFEVSCDESFLTTLLFRKSASSTIHVLPESSSASPGGTTSEKVESLCFVQNNLCSYEGSLWAAFVLDSVGGGENHEVTSYLPYLLTLAEDNKVFLPDMFLYSVTSDLQHRTSLLSKQKSKKYWSESGDKFYDTALALYPFQQETLQEKTNSKEWLLSVQDANGCWENNVRNTGFILNSIWPRSFSGSGGGGGGGAGGENQTPDNAFSCEEAGYTCTTTSLCNENGGDILSEYDCPAPSNCCTISPRQPTCADQGGEICSSNERCIGGVELSASDTEGQNCCVGGDTCEIATPSDESFSECEASGGTCRSFECNDDEELSTFYSCSFTGDSCCITKTTSSPKGSLLWVWLLLVFIVLAVIGILFREKLRMLWLRMSKGRSGGSLGSSSRPGPGYPPSFPPPTQFFQRPFQAIERRIMPPQHQPQRTPTHTQQRPAPRPKSGAQKELDDVLKKLKEMSK